ncbi:MAG: cell wall-binding repeat-containing protein, partial [Acidimicrobiales bacterium]
NNPTSGSGSSGGGNTTGSNSGSTNLVASGCNNLLGCVVNLGLIQTSAGAAAPGVVPPTGGEAYPYEDGNLGTIELLGGAVNVPLNDGPNTVINLGILSITLNQQSYDPTTNTASNQGVVLNFPDTGLLSAILSGTITVSSSTASTSGTLSCPPGVSLTSISPTSGPIAGGTTVTLTGTNFAAGAPVAFGSNPATNIDVVNSTTITAKSPRGLKGPALVTVYNCPSTSDFTYTGSPVMRFGGGNRIQTAIAVSKGAYPATGSAGGVVLASDLDFTDGLAGVPLASQKDAPLLLTEPTNERNGINPEVLTEIQRVLTPHANKPVYIIGGYGTLAKSIDSTLSGLGYNPIRIAGSNAPATAVAAAHAQGNPNTVFLVTDTNFADALSAGPAAIKQNGTVLFTNGPNMAPETRTYLNAHPGDAVFAVGGPAASADRQATPIVGADEFATDTLVAAFFGNPTVIGVARGDLFPDALDGGTMVATDGGPIILVNPDVPIPSASQAYFVKEKPYIQMVNVYGGTGAVSDAVVSDINADLGT